MIQKMKNELESKEAFMEKSVGAAMRIGFVALLFVLSFGILKPFLSPVAWGIIFAIGIYPLHKKFAKLLGNRAKLSAVLITIIGISIIVIPSVLFTSSMVENVGKTVDAIEDETLEVPPPNEKVKDWPFIGERAYEVWSSANKNMTSTLQKYKSQLKELAPKLTKTITGVVGSVLLFIISMIIGGVLLGYAKPGEKAANQIFKTFVGEKSKDFTKLSIGTIHSVVVGVLGIAVIQTFFLSLGMFVIDVPAAGVLAIVVLIVCVIQVPPLLIMLPITIYVFSFAETGPAIIFTAWTIFWAISDMILKPIFLGKGVDIPMLVVLLGAIGGMVLGGPVGLFVGSVILTLAYKILMAMLKDSSEKSEELDKEP
jgi:predicted PurR-regulated permease PerM